MADILRARILAVACGHEDATISTDCAPIQPSSGPADGCPIAGSAALAADLLAAGEPTRQRAVIRFGRVLVDLSLSSYAALPKSVTLDVDDALDVVHCHQQLSLFKPATTSVASCQCMSRTLGVSRSLAHHPRRYEGAVMLRNDHQLGSTGHSSSE